MIKDTGAIPGGLQAGAAGYHCCYSGLNSGENLGQGREHTRVIYETGSQETAKDTLSFSGKGKGGPPPKHAEVTLPPPPQEHSF